MSSDEEEWDEGKGTAGTTPAAAAANYPVLKGRLKLNTESHLVFLGLWSMKLATVDDSKCKFKLKSVQPVTTDFLKSPLPSVTLKGFFHADAADPVEAYRKIPEPSVTLNFRKTGPATYQIRGQGSNPFGDFRLDGIYNAQPTNSEHIHWLQCKKVYGSTGDDDDDDDDDIGSDEDHGADEEELNGLEEDAELSVEELRAKYYRSAAAADDDEEKPPAAKKQKT